jgi:hypothetical protein
MLKIAKKYNIGIDAMKISVDTKRKLPIWHHIAITDNYTWNKKATKCIRENHKIKTVRQLENLKYNRPANNKKCENPVRCQNIMTTLLNKLPPKFNPDNKTPHKDNLDHTNRRKRKNRRQDIKEAPIYFDPNVTETGDPNNAIRIFGSKVRSKKRKYVDKSLQNNPAYRPKGKVIKNNITLYTDGSCFKNGTDTARAGYNIWHEDNSENNRTERLQGPIQLN